MLRLTEGKIMLKIGKKAVCAVVAALVALACLPLQSFADGEWAPSVIGGLYSFTSNETEINLQGSDSFVYRDECFMRSAYDGCTHLATLSAQAALASASRWGDELDPENVDDTAENAKNIVDMLGGMGFADVETNRYYTLEKQENGAAAAVGHRTIVADGKTYTLLAVVPRSAGYKQEWTGNFNVGEGDFHDGFKQGRDEILRFVRQYLESHGITGDLKVWIAGHSRGAAIANSLGGFFAGGGASYFENVTVTPENVYCYTFATPKTVKNTLSKKAYLSVSGAREDTIYANDTPGDAYVYPEDGTLDPHDPVFNCVRNYPLPFDFITMLPPAAWGYTDFGTIESFDANGAVTVEEMLEELGVLAPFAYDEFVGGGDFRNFRMQKFDFALLAPVDDPSASGQLTMAEFLAQRIQGLVHVVPTSVDYVQNGGEETLQAVAGLYGMLHSFKGIDIDSITNILAEPLMLAYITYGRERLKEENRIANDATDDEAACAVLCDLLSYVTESEITASTSTDTAIAAVVKFIADRENTPLYNTLVSTVAGMLPEDASSAAMISAMLRLFVTDPEASKEDMIGAVLKACVYGPEEGTDAFEQGASAETVRTLVYTALSIDNEDLGTAVGYGYSPISSLVSYLVKTLRVKEKDDGGAPLAYYDTIDEAADAKLAAALKTIISPLVEKHTGKYGDLFDAQLANHFDTLLLGKNVTMLRNLLASTILYTEGKPFGAESALANAATFLQCTSMIPLAHYNEVNAAWCKAIEKKLNVTPPRSSDPIENGSAQQLVVPAKTKEGERIIYALGRDGVTVPPDEAFSETVPTASEAGTYYVWYRTTGQSGTSEASCVTATIYAPGQIVPDPQTGDTGMYVPAFVIIVSLAVPVVLFGKKKKAARKGAADTEN